MFVCWGLENKGMGLICNRMTTGWPAHDQDQHLVLFSALYQSTCKKSRMVVSCFLDVLNTMICKCNFALHLLLKAHVKYQSKNY